MLGYKTKLQKVKEAIDASDLAYLKSHSAALTRGKHEDACAYAIAKEAPAALTILLSNHGFDFTSSAEDDRAHAHKLIEKAQASPAAEALMNALAAENAAPHSTSLSADEFLSAETSVSTLQALLEADAGNFEACVSKTGFQSTEKLKFILSFAARAGDVQDFLTKTMVRLAENGDAEKVALLLQRGADPDYGTALALSRAAANGHAQVVSLLLPVTDMAAYGDDLVLQLEQKGADGDMIDAVARATENAKAAAVVQETEAAAAPVTTESESGLRRIDANTLTETQTLPDGGTLTSLYNFRSRQQQNILDPHDGRAPVLNIVSFSDMDQGMLATLRQALDEMNAPPATAPALEASRRFSTRAKQAGLS